MFKRDQTWKGTSRKNWFSVEDTEGWKNIRRNPFYVLYIWSLVVRYLALHPIIRNYFKVCRQRESYVGIARPTLNCHKFYISSDGRIILIYSKHDTNNYGKIVTNFPAVNCFESCASYLKDFSKKCYISQVGLYYSIAIFDAFISHSVEKSQICWILLFFVTIKDINLMLSLLYLW